MKIKFQISMAGMIDGRDRSVSPGEVVDFRDEAEAAKLVAAGIAVPAEPAKIGKRKIVAASEIEIRD